MDDWIPVTQTDDWQPVAKSAPNISSDMAASLGSGAVKSGIGLLGMIGDLSEYGARGLDVATRYVGDKLGYDIAERPNQEPLGGSAQIRRGIESITGPLYEPQTTAGEYASTVGEFAPALIGGVPSLGRRVLTQVLAPAVASETAGQLTKGTAAEPVARFAGALAGAGGAATAASRLERSTVPTVEELQGAAKALYDSPAIAGLELKPQAMRDFVTNVDQQLLSKKVDKYVAPTVTGILERLQAPRFGKTGTVADFDLARQSLSDVPHNERRAAGVVRQAIDDYLGNIPKGHVIAGDAQAANAALLEARGNYAASKRAEDVANAMTRGENQAGATYSGGNVENATRQQLKTILNQKQGVSKSKAFQDYTAEELAALKKAVNGTAYGNLVRALGKSLGGGGGLGNVVAGGAAGGAAYGQGYDPQTAGLIGILAMLGGRGLNAYGNRLAVNRAAELSELLRSRSPLSASRVVPKPSNNFLYLGPVYSANAANQ